MSAQAEPRLALAALARLARATGQSSGTVRRSLLSGAAGTAGTITGLSYASAILLLLARQPDLAGVVLGALGVGSAGVLWTEYSTRAGARLRLAALRRGGRLTRTEALFAGTHAPALLIGAALLYRAARPGPPGVR